MHPLAWAVILSFGAFATIRGIRTLLAGRPVAECKPIACDLCMSVWTGMAGSALLWIRKDLDGIDTVVLAGSTAGLTMILLRLYDSMIPIAHLPKLND